MAARAQLRRAAAAAAAAAAATAAAAAGAAAAGSSADEPRDHADPHAGETFIPSPRALSLSPHPPAHPLPRAVHAACLASGSTRLAGRPRYARHAFFPVPPRMPQAAAQAAQLSASSTAVTGKSTGEVEKKKRRKKLETVIMEADQLADDDFQVGVRVARTNGNVGHDTTNRLSRAIGKLASWCCLRQCVHLLLLGGEERGLHTLQDGLSHH